MTDIDAWIDGAQRMRRSVLIYQRPDLVADLDTINQEMTTAKAAGLDIGDYEARWTATAQAFADSGLRVTVEGQTMDEITAAKAAGVGDDDEQASARLLAAAIVSPLMTVEQVMRLRDAIGDAQIDIITSAWRSACFDAPPMGPGVDDDE